MKKNGLFFVCIVSCIPALSNSQETIAAKKIEQYRSFLIEGTYTHQDWSKFDVKPLSRYETFLHVLNYFEKNQGKIIVELGTTRSFVHGGHKGCNKDDIHYWMPDQPQHWDWSAGCFTRVASECLAHCTPEIHTIDNDAAAMRRCQIMTAEFSHLITYHTTTSEQFLRTCNFKNGIDLLYLDTGYMNPIEPTAKLQLLEAQIIVERNLLAPGGLLLIDDVRNQNVLNADSDLGKSKYAIPYLLNHGFEKIADGYQVILRKKTGSR